MNENYDPNYDITTYIEKKQDARYRLCELAQQASDSSIIRATILELEVHSEWLKPIDKFR